ncbi:albusnodin/ikarugamycin family macrolactam cyclase [Lipingzhangella sp. LS1_29]|uniref:asparagine synthase (glutamine-hydrolyzing) n=1 Tax=Lipingzhangella rawalii TaxID=2055835 RepID=A0ABU2H194_9ACTN|nr:albusnodin/ikarugamycin family macrolactam cyclase [Lipingzhangella rawalii]MDS1269066.1 albusnodin/ikarugamycin family macrolactam cyclase [Lipingzhangella rawalii]
MHWIQGHRPPQPTATTPLWTDHDAPHVVGANPPPMHCATDRDLRLAVIGDCYAPRSALDLALPAVRAEDWRALTRWPGSYWVIARRGPWTAILTDLCGSRSVYYTRHRGQVRWATRTRPLAELTGAPLDDAALAAHLTCPTVTEATDHRTAYRGIHRVPGAHALVTDRHTLRIVPYEPEAPTATFPEAAAALRVALYTAVAHRANTAQRLSADVSGGLDSTSLAMLADTHGPLLGVTRLDSTSPNDDPDYARRCVAQANHMRHVFPSAGQDARMFDQLDAAPSTDQPFSDAARWAVTTSYRQPLHEYGSSLHLTGSGGDTLLEAAPYHLAEAYRTQSRRAFRTRVLAFAQVRQLSPRVIARAARAQARTACRDALHQFAEQIRTPQRHRRTGATERIAWYGTAGFAVWLTSRARATLAEHLHAQAEQAQPDLPLATHRAWSELREFGSYQAELEQQLSHDGVPTHAPYLDNEVVRSCMALPVSHRSQPGVQKPLLGAALRGLVPLFLLTRATKGAYDGNAYSGLRRNAARLRTLLTDSHLVERGIVDQNTVRDELDRLVTGVPGRIAALERLVSVELWLARTLDSAARVPSESGGSYAR